MVSKRKQHVRLEWATLSLDYWTAKLLSEERMWRNSALVGICLSLFGDLSVRACSEQMYDVTASCVNKMFLVAAAVILSVTFIGIVVSINSQVMEHYGVTSRLVAAN